MSARRSKKPTRPRAFLGTGWSFPPRFRARGREVELVSGVEDIHESLQILLATAPLERVMQESYGCDLKAVQFEEIDQDLVNRVTALISDAILYHEPRIRLERLDVDESESLQGVLMLRLDYTIQSTNTRYNMVYPFYLNEATTPGA